MKYIIYRKISEDEFKPYVLDMVAILIYAGIASSKSQAKRLLLNGEIIKQPVDGGLLIRHGRRKQVKISLPEGDYYEDEE